MSGWRHCTLMVVLLSAMAGSAQEAATQGASVATPAEVPALPQPATSAAQTVTPAPQASTPAPASGPQQPVPGQPMQNPDGTYTIRTSSRLVILDMVAVDAKGKPVQGLAQSDFTVTEGGDAQTITHFEEGGRRLPDAAVDIESTADLDRLAPRAPVNIILLDEFNTRFEDEAFARYSLKKFLERQPDHLATPTMLLAVSLDKFEVLRDYTQNKQLLIEALDHHFVANPWRNTSSSWAAERYGTAFLTLRRVAQAVIGHEGRKNMIWIGRGFPSINMVGVSVDTTNRINSYRQDCVNILRDARVTLTTIDPAGLMVDPGVYGYYAGTFEPFGGNYQFSQLAAATGGRAIYGRNDVDAQIGEAAEDGEHFYTLTYRPTNTSRDPSKFRKIKVTVDRPGVQVFTRQGYYLAYRAPAGNVQAPGRRLISDLVSAETSTMAYDGIDLTLKPEVTTGKYQLHIGARSLAWAPAVDGKPRTTQLILVVTTFDKKGKELKRDAKAMVIGAPASAAPTGRIEVPVNLDYKLEPDAKAVRARFVVRMTASGRLGTADVDLTKPFAEQVPTIVPPEPGAGGTAPPLARPQP